MKLFILLSLILSSISLKAADINPSISLMKAVKTLASADLNCTTNDDCMVVELGSRACGGPTKFEIVSKKNDNYEELVQLAQVSVEKGLIYNKENNVFSVGSELKAPEVSCIQNTCTVTK